MLYGIILSVMVIYVIYYVKRFSKNLVRQLSVKILRLEKRLLLMGIFFLLNRHLS